MNLAVDFGTLTAFESTHTIIGPKGFSDNPNNFCWQNTENNDIIVKLAYCGAAAMI